MAKLVRISLIKKMIAPQVSEVLNSEKTADLKRLQLLQDDCSKSTGLQNYKTFDCNFCEENFATDILLENHLRIFHRISKNRPSDKPSTQWIENANNSSQVPKAGKRTSHCTVKKEKQKTLTIGSPDLSSASVKIPVVSKFASKSSQNDGNEDRQVAKHQCYVCALEFNLMSTLKLHLEKVHLVRDQEVKQETLNDCAPNKKGRPRRAASLKVEKLFEAEFKEDNDFNNDFSQQSYNEDDDYDYVVVPDDGLRDMSSDDENPTAETKELVLTSTQLSNSAVEGNVAALADDHAIEDDWLDYNEDNSKVDIPSTDTTKAVEPSAKKSVKPLKCFLCYKYFTKEESRNNHLVQCHRPSPSQICDLCKPGKHFFSARSFGFHQLIKHKIPYPCPGCDEKIPTFAGISAHNKIYHWKVNRGNHGTCEICGKEVINLERHKRNAHSEKETCPICDSQIAKRGLPKHLETHAKRKRDHLCSTCGKGFFNDVMLKSHQIVHQATENIPCEMCGKIFKHSRALRMHINNNHSGTVFPCETCGKECQSKEKLKSHQYCHADERLICASCGKVCKSARSLTSHIFLSHTVHKCEQCDMTFSSPLKKARHVNDKHKKMKMFDGVECKICGKKMKNNFSLINHVRFVHQKKSHFKCDLCPDGNQRAFSSNSHVKRHKLQVHKDDPRVAHLVPKYGHLARNFKRSTIGNGKGNKVAESDTVSAKVLPSKRSKRETATTKFKDYLLISEDGYNEEEEDLCPDEPEEIVTYII